MKLIIQIPCLNERETLGVTIEALPKRVHGFATVEFLIIDDGSRDGTADEARRLGVHHVVRHPKNLGLARAFMTGIDACLRLGADVIVNTDADNQYEAADIPALTRPILAGQADYVIGTRPIADIPHFSPIKKRLQKLGSWVVRVASGTRVDDAPSGFRAISRAAACRLNVFSEYTYTLETIIQAGRQGFAITTSPVRVNQDLRPSRLVKSIRSYIQRSILTILRILVVYRPMAFFLRLGLLPFIPGAFLCVRWLVLFFLGTERSHVPSLVAAAVLLLLAAICWALAVIGDLIAKNRMLLEQNQARLREMSVGTWEQVPDHLAGVVPQLDDGSGETFS